MGVPDGALQTLCFALQKAQQLGLGAAVPNSKVLDTLTRESDMQL